MISRSMLWFRLSGSSILAKNSALSLMSSVYSVLMPGGLLEVGHRLLVDVERPVGDRAASCRRRRPPRPPNLRRPRRAFLAAATGGQQAIPEHQAARAQRGSPDEPAAVDRLAEQGVQLVVSRVGLASAHGRHSCGGTGDGDGGAGYGWRGMARSIVCCGGQSSSRLTAATPAAGGSSRAASVSQPTQRPRPGRRSGSDCSGPTWATISVRSAARSVHRTTGP